MRHRSCPEQEKWLELASISAELPLYRRLGLRWHLSSCAPCKSTYTEVESAFRSYFSPEPDVTSSLLRVYGELKRDETLLLKGWKLDEVTPQRDLRFFLFQRGWLFRGGLAVAAVALAWGIFGPDGSITPPTDVPVAAAPPDNLARSPWAQIRIEEKNSVKVHYLRPELLHSSEFETTSTPVNYQPPSSPSPELQQGR